MANREGLGGWVGEMAGERLDNREGMRKWNGCQRRYPSRGQMVETNVLNAIK